MLTVIFAFVFFVYQNLFHHFYFEVSLLLHCIIHSHSYGCKTFKSHTNTCNRAQLSNFVTMFNLVANNVFVTSLQISPPENVCFLFSNSFVLTTSQAVLMSGHDQFNVSGLLGGLQKFHKVSSIFIFHIQLWESEVWIGCKVVCLPICWMVETLAYSQP